MNKLTITKKEPTPHLILDVNVASWLEAHDINQWSDYGTWLKDLWKVINEHQPKIANRADIYDYFSKYINSIGMNRYYFILVKPTWTVFFSEELFARKGITILEQMLESYGYNYSETETYLNKTILYLPISTQLSVVAFLVK